MENTQKTNKSRKKKTGRLLFVLGLTAVILVVATYAWFIGISVVTVESFSVSILSDDGLLLSLDGQNFSTSVNLGANESTIMNTLKSIYNNSTNSWPGDDEGETGVLVPLSTIGEMNQNSSTLKLFDKTSITSSVGGYLFRASQIENERISGGSGNETYTAQELDGYIVFDLFIKNNNGGNYNQTFNYLDDEALYMISNSTVSLSSSGTGGDGLENSMRVAFMQIGRVNSLNSTVDEITGITCAGGGNTTGLCNKGEAGDTTKNAGRGITWNIWEPNDMAHTEESEAHFARVCRTRAEATSPQTGLVYSTTRCTFPTGYAHTYAVNQEIVASDMIDIYDGLNGYTGHTEGSSAKLTDLDYYTSTEIAQSDGLRPQLFFIASNSITKVRVYIFLEGQDIDNFDIKSEGKSIEIEFGFTKDPYGGLPEEEPEEPQEPEPEEP